MKKFIYFSLLVFSISAIDALAYKIIKVKGNTAYFSRKGIKARKGQKLKVYADGYEVGVIKVVKLKGKYGIAKIIEGAIGKGDRLKNKKSGSKKRKGSRSSRSGPSDFIAYGGLGFYVLNDLSDDSGSLLDFGNHMVLSFGADYAMFSSFVLSAYFNYAISGDSTAIQLAGAPVFDTSLWELNIDGAYYFTPAFYGKAGVGITSFSYEGSVTEDANPALNGGYDGSFFGFNFGLGGGMKLNLGEKFVFKTDVTYRSVTYSSGDVTTPSASSSGDPGFSQSHIDILFLFGYKI